MSIKNAWNITKRSFADFYNSNCFKLSASLAYFTVFSLPGLLIIIIWFSEFFYGRSIVEGSVYGQLENFVGHSVALSIQEAVQNVTTSAGSTLATIVGIVSLEKFRVRKLSVLRK